MDAIIFDMDGVLIDSEYTYLESKTNILKDAGINCDTSYQYQFMGTTYEFMWNRMKEELDLPNDIYYYIEEMNTRRIEMMNQDVVTSIKNVEKFVRDLYQEGFRMAVASSIGLLVGWQFF